MFYLMNKDKIILSFEKTSASADASFAVTEIYENKLLPIGFSDINSFIDGRKASSHNEHLKSIMRRYGCDDPIGFIRVTHAASINDTFWIRSDRERVCWKDISLYDNPFTEVISRLAFEGVGLYEEVFSLASPELVTDGSYPKCFIREEEGIYIYKRGSSGTINAGKEPYCEHMSSEIAKVLCRNSVSYDLVNFHDRMASKCRLFTDECTGYTSVAKVFGREKVSFDDELRMFSEIGAEEAYREMVVLDSVIFNEDRHRGNYGVLFNTDSLQLKGMAPIFDLNMSLLFSFMPEDFENLGDVLLEHGPKIGNDFLQIGHAALTDNIRDRIKDLKDFHFSFRGDDFFTAERVKTLEEIVGRQSEALLSNDKIQTKDVFIPAHPDYSAEKSRIMQEQLIPLAERICDELDTIPGYFSSIETNEDGIIIYLEEEIPKDDISFRIDLLFGNIECYQKNIKISVDDNPVAQKCQKIYEDLFPQKERDMFFAKYEEIFTQAEDKDERDSR